MPIWVIIFLVIVALLLMGNAFMAGYTYGLYKSLFIQKPQQQAEKPKVEYNESLVGLLPAEVQQYYQETNGHNKF